jgi:hypothetical protein
VRALSPSSPLSITCRSTALKSSSVNRAPRAIVHDRCHPRNPSRPALEGTGGAPTPAYLNVSYQDVIYAQNPQHCAQLVIDYYYPAGVAFWITAQKLLDIASGELFGQSYPYR